MNCFMWMLYVDVFVWMLCVDRCVQLCVCVCVCCISRSMMCLCVDAACMDGVYRCMGRARRGCGVGECVNERMGVSLKCSNGLP